MLTELVADQSVIRREAANRHADDICETVRDDDVKEVSQATWVDSFTQTYSPAVK